MKRMLVLWFLITIFSGFAQQSDKSLTIDDIVEKTILNMSPQMASMVMYNDQKISLNTGRLDLEIPLVNFDDPDFDFPISIRYNSEGFKPSTPDNFVGRDWSLNCGGMIYREIKGTADDLPIINPEGVDPFGFLLTCRSGKYHQELIKDQVLNNNPSKIIQSNYLDVIGSTLSFIDTNFNEEFSSDIYHFNFGKHSGKFIINFDGTVTVSGKEGGKYKVDISRYLLSNSVKEYKSEIRITTDDGYIYCFGGSYEAVEYTALSWETSYPDPGNHIITGFYLTKIIAPSGRTLSISYLGENIDAIYHEKPRLLLSENNCEWLVSNNYPLFYSYRSEPVLYNYASWKIMWQLPRFEIFELIGVSNSTSDSRNNLNKTALIDKIETDDKTISFSYSPRKKSMYRSGIPFLNICGAQLDEITLRSSSEVESSKLHYTYTSEPYSRMFLSGINNSKEGAYTFLYDQPLDSVDPLTTHIDHWGYWQGTDPVYGGLIPAIKEAVLNNPLSTNDYEYDSNNMEPNGRECSFYLLNKITYPTGGYVTVEYEPNNYSCQLIRNSQTAYYKRLQNIGYNLPYGGARVKEIKYFSSASDLVRKTRYGYTDKPGSDLSSGILLYKPQYYHLSRTAAFEDQYCVLYNNRGFNDSDYASRPLQYSTVIRYDNGYSEETIPGYENVRIDHSAANSDGIRSVHVVVGQLSALPGGDEIEELYSNWEITLRPGSPVGSFCSIKITNSGTKEIVFEKRADYDPENDNYERITLNPYKKFGKGNYRIDLEKKGYSSVSFLATCPGSLNTKVVSGAAVVTNFSDYRTNPDFYTDKHTFWGRMYERISVMPFPELDSLYLKRNFLEPEDYSIERGRILSQIYLDEKMDTLQMVEYKYARQGFDRFGIYASLPSVKSNACASSLYAQINKIRFYTYKPVKKTTRYYYPNHTYDVTEKYDYDDDGYLLRQSKDISSGVQKIYEFEYSAKESELAANNIVGLVTKKTEKEKTYAKEIELFRTEYAYNTQGKLVSATNYSGNEIVSWTRYSNFDLFGNPTNVKTHRGQNIIYLWGYKGKYPVAKIENATPEDIVRITKQKPEDLSQIFINTLIDTTNLLRDQLPDAKVTTYTYNPLIGIASITDPSGQKRTFTYDSAHRLIRETLFTEIGTYQTLKLHEYNLLNQ